MRRILLQQLFVFVMTMVVTASPVKAEKIRITGGGTSTCEEWVMSRRNGKALVEESWATGYLSGAAKYSSDLNPLNGIESNTVEHWIDNYCASNQLKKVVHALDEFIKEHPR